MIVPGIVAGGGGGVTPPEGFAFVIQGAGNYVIQGAGNRVIVPSEDGMDIELADALAALTGTITMGCTLEPDAVIARAVTAGETFTVAGDAVFQAGVDFQHSGVVYSGVSTSDPQNANELWNDTGNAKFSAG